MSASRRSVAPLELTPFPRKHHTWTSHHHHQCASEGINSSSLEAQSYSLRILADVHTTTDGLLTALPSTSASSPGTSCFDNASFQRAPSLHLSIFIPSKAECV
ncbi:unnamed protein product [Mesocestoides corti]|uniref:Uncharacterized protein n=1 Tax=Mesocestoides corti TaxID=53468 RepID=A0A0R3U8D0_MESCO|nr:unnamed protein product [Mesocestoides corti]